MNILYTCDNNYIFLAGISMISLFENNRDVNDISVFLLGDKVSDANKKTLKSIADKYNRTFEAIDVLPMDAFKTFASQRWPISAFIRLYAPQYLPKSIDKILYLDCDTIITKNISSLENFQMEDFAIAGVKDCLCGLYKKNIGLQVDSPYFNAGVLLMNLNKMRTIKINQKVDIFLKTYTKKIIYADQDVLNGALHGYFAILPPAYNVMTLAFSHSFNEIEILRKPTIYYSKEEMEYAVKNPAIVHFTTCMTNVRPWFENSAHPYAKEFDRFKNLSPWKNLKKQKMVFNTGKATVVKFLFHLPRPFAIYLLGFLHAQLRPTINRLK